MQWLARRADFNDSHPATPLLPGRCQDIEFTVENGKLYMLQTRTGKRTARAAVRIAVDMVKERMLTEREALMRIDAAQVRRAPLQISSSSSLTGNLEEAIVLPLPRGGERRGGGGGGESSPT